MPVVACGWGWDFLASALPAPLASVWCAATVLQLWRPYVFTRVPVTLLKFVILVMPVLGWYRVRVVAALSLDKGPYDAS